MIPDDSELRAAARRLGRVLEAAGRAVASAESCTGGLIAKLITDIAGSSEWFERGFITYSNAAKQEMLGVGAELLETHGAVSAAVAEAMALGALHYSRARISVSVTGVAGPEGGTPDKPVGLVWIAWAGPDSGALSRRYQFAGDRDAVRRQAAAAALEGLEQRAGR